VRETGAGAAELGAEAAHTTTMAAGAVAATGDQIWNTLTTGDESLNQSNKTTMQDAVFDFDKKYVQPAIQHWQPLEDSGAIARGIHQAATMIAAAPLGPAGVAQFVTNAFSQSATDAIDKGTDVPAAMAGATVDAAGSWLMMKVLGRDALGQFKDKIPTDMIRRVMTAIPTGDLINIGQDLTKKFLLDQNGNDKQAQGYLSKIGEHLTNLEELATNAIYGAVGSHGEGAKEPEANPPAPGAPPPPPASVAAAPEKPMPPPPPEPAQAAAPKPAPAPPVPVVPDKPTGESAADVRAQFTDMRQSGTVRRGVLITPDTQDHLNTLPDGHAQGDAIKNQIEQARSQGRSVQTPVGELIVKTKGDAAKATAQLKTEDPQVVIGRYTGAGNGKDPAQTVVVQGREIQNGAITSESAVKPEDQGAATQAVIDQGKIPVITTPDAVISDRTQKMNEERRKANLPVEVDRRAAAGERSNSLVGQIANEHSQGRGGFTNEEGTATGAEAPLPKEADEGRVTEVPAGELENAPGTQKEAPPSVEAPKEKAAPAPSGEAEKPREGFLKTDSGKEVPVHIAGEAGEGKLTVHPLDENGERGEPRTVPAERVRTTAEKAPEAPKVEQAAPAKAGSALDQLLEALAAHERQEQAAAGRKNSAPLKERQDNASAFAQVLAAAAKESAEKGRASDTAVQRAAEAAKSAARLTDKSKEDTDKGRGTGHSLVTARVAEMHKAARELLGKGTEADKVTVTPKQAKVAERAAKPQPAAPVEKPVEGADSAKVAEIAKAVARGDTRLTMKDLNNKHDVPPRDFERIKKLVQDKLSEGKKAERKKTEAEKPPQATKAETETWHALSDKYLKAETPEKAKAVRDALIEHIKAVHARLGAPEEQARTEADAWLEHLSDTREQMGKREPPKMSDTVEPEEHEVNRKELSDEEGFQSVYRPSGASKIVKLLTGNWNERTKATRAAMHDLGLEAGNAGLLRSFKAIRDTGIPMQYHSVLKRLLPHAKGELLDRITQLLARAPDVPFYVNSEIISPNTGKQMHSGIKGLFHYNIRGSGEAAHSIQLRLNENTKPYTMLHAILHEGEHAATMIEIERNPTGALANQLRAARSILMNRLDAKFAQAGHGALASAYARMLNGEEDPLRQPSDNAQQLASHLYGLKDIHEMMAELHTNPEFLEEVIRSEDWAQPNEDVPLVGRGEPSLLMKMVAAVARFMGYANPKLALHMMELTERTSTEQMGSHPELYRPGAYADLANAQMPAFRKAQREQGRGSAADIAMAEGEEEGRELAKPAKPVKAEGAIGRMISQEAASAARDRLHEFTSKSVDMGRNIVMALKTVGQIFRDGKDAFGHDDDTNPLNQLRDVMGEKNKLMSQMRAVTNPVAKLWQRLSNRDDQAVSQLMIDTSTWKIDPREKARVSEPSARQSEYYRRYDQLSDKARAVYDQATDANKAIRGVQRRAAVDSAIEGFGLDITDGQRAQLYGAKDPGAFDRLIGPGKLVDVGDKNDKLRNALHEWVGNDVEGPYHHLGRVGEYVVQAKPEGTKEFGASQEKAEAFAKMVKDESPGSKATAEERGGQWVVDYKADHVSMHETRVEAERAREALQSRGFDVQPVTQKAYTREQAGNLSSGMRELMTSAIQKITRGGANDKGTQALADNLHSAYLQMQADRSAYAGSRLMRKSFAGTKAKDMKRNFAEHASSSMYHTAQIRTVFREAEAMSRMRNMARDENATQAQLYSRGEIVSALNDHAAQAAQQMKRGNFSASMAKLGFMSYLASPAHAAIWLTQNYTTGVPWAAARYGYGRTIAAFGKAHAVWGPALRATWNEAITGGLSGDEIHSKVMDAIAKHPTLGKWAPALREMGARGVISHGYANELSEMARGNNAATGRAVDVARLLPAMADAINRISTALAGLEITGGDIRKASDMVEAVHADYSAQNRPSAFKAIGRGPLRSALMFKTYAQEMAHMTYSNLVAAAKFLSKDPATKAAAWTGAKTLGGLMVTNAMFAGVYGSVGLEPARLLIYAYHKIFDEEGEVWDMKNAVHHFLVDHFGAGVGNSLARGPIADALGVDVSDRMGLANLFFHNPPDLLTTDKDTWKSFVMDEGGPLLQYLVNGITGATGHIQNGEYAQAIGSVVPIKLVQDGLKGLDLLNSGKETGAGAHITQPSALDAAKQTFGLKPASVADAQERQEIKAEYKEVKGQTKGSIIKELLSHPEGSPEREEARARLRAFNERNPGAGIGKGEIKRAATANFKTSNQVLTRDQRLNQAEDFSGD
jgi:hypothetical protein